MAAPRRPGDTVPAAAPASPPQAAGQVLSPLPQRIYSEDSLADRDPASPGHRLFPAGTPQLPASRAPPPAAASAAAPPRRGSQRSRTPPAELRAAAQRLGATPSEDAASLDRGAVAEDGVCPCRAARSGEAPRPAAGAVALADWEAALDAEGALSPQQWAELRRRVFTFGCADADARKVVWTHLLQVIPVGCSAATRREREERLRREYLHYRQQYRMVTPAQRKHWAAFTEREQQVQRDVLRTDRASPLFSDEHGEGVRQLRDVLMAHQMYNHDLGYCQGMNEVAALLLRVLGDDALAFWGLVCMMEGRLQLHRTFAWTCWPVCYGSWILSSPGISLSSTPPFSLRSGGWRCASNATSLPMTPSASGMPGWPVPRGTSTSSSPVRCSAKGPCGAGCCGAARRTRSPPPVQEHGCASRQTPPPL
eukprot:TRINITY_DN26098_c0_g1_i1.p1 TRINITY_DN26098_c0_g1~~TRINITY_DN26098_c0_g1_i1.p1  ORF type:complete len:460 (+),score=83.43 TRINITY_DN26098_c0_g1_i1:112-1380(+)